MVGDVTTEAFDAALIEIANELGAEHLIVSIPGVYEIVAEHLNNDVLKRLQEKRDAEEDGQVPEP